MLLTSEYDIIVDPARSMIIYLTIAMVIGAYLIGLYVLLASRNPEKSLSSKYFIGLAIFAILFGTGRLIYMIHDYFSPDIIGDINMDVLLWKIATATAAGGMIFLVFTIETFVYKKTKRIFTIIGACLLIIVIVAEFQIARYASYATTVILAIVPFLIYITIYKNATGVVKKRALIILIGMILLALGQGTSLFDNVLGIMTKEQASMFAPPVTLAGLAITGIGLISMSR
jgi:hypothetical protein